MLCCVFLETFLLNIHVFDQMLQACCSNRRRYGYARRGGRPPLPPCGLPPVWWGDARIHPVADDTERSMGGLGTARGSLLPILLVVLGLGSRFVLACSGLQSR